MDWCCWEKDMVEFSFSLVILGSYWVAVSLVILSSNFGYIWIYLDGCILCEFGSCSWDAIFNFWAATSKSDQFTETDAASGSFGSRGEALASISDVSLLEVVTKASGRPNGYRKVMKVWFCSFFGFSVHNRISLQKCRLGSGWLFSIFLRDPNVCILE